MSTRHFKCGDVNDVNIVAREYGDAGHQPIIFLHGGGQTSRAWRHTAKRFATLGYYVLSVDLRGHGDSDWSPGSDYSSDAFVSDLKVIIASLEQDVILVGASLGGLVSLMTVGESTDHHVKTMVMVDVTPTLDMTGRDKILGFMKSGVSGFASVDEAADAVSAYLPYRKRPSDNSGLKHNLRQREDGRYYWHWDPSFFSGENATHTDSNERYRQAAKNVTIPTLLVRGEKSELVTEEGVKDFLALIPHAEYVDVTGAHHMVVGDDNDTFSEAVLNFLGTSFESTEAS